MEILENMQLAGAPYFNAKKWVSPQNFAPEVMTGEISKDIYIHDVTLRDGEQTCGLNWTEDERIRIAVALDEIGVQRIEVGMPVVSEDIRSAIERLVKMGLGAEIIPFARALKGDIDASAETGVRAIVVEHAVNPYLCKYAYDVDTEQLIDRIAGAIEYARSLGLKTTFMGWDVTRATLDYVRKVYKAVVEKSHPEAVVFTDSFGVASPLAIYRAIKALKEDLPGVRVELHIHNEFGMAMGSVVAAAYAGVDGIHASINGLGERTGNVPTEEVVTALELLLNIHTGIKLEKLAAVSRLVEDISGVPVWRNKPVMGKRLFMAESGVVIHAKQKLEAQGIKAAMMPYLPEIVGHEELQVVFGGSSGKASVSYFLDKLGIGCTEEEAEAILEKVKALGRAKRDIVSEEELKEIIDRVREASCVETGNNPEP